MKKILVSAIIALCASLGAVAPASANFQFNPSDLNALGALGSDICIPLPDGTEYCITWTNATYLLELGMAKNQQQMGAMLSQGLQDGQISQLELSFGMTDTQGFNNAAAIGAAAVANPYNPTYSAASTYLNQISQRTNNQQAMYNAMYANGSQSPLAQQQLNGVMLLQLNEAMAEESQIEAQAAVEQYNDGVNAGIGMGSYFDVAAPSNDSTGGFSW